MTGISRNERVVCLSRVADTNKILKTRRSNVEKQVDSITNDSRKHIDTAKETAVMYVHMIFPYPFPFVEDPAFLSLLVAEKTNESTSVAIVKTPPTIAHVLNNEIGSQTAVGIDVRNITHDVKKCAKLCLISVCWTCMGEISKLKYAPG